MELDAIIEKCRKGEILPEDEYAALIDRICEERILNSEYDAVRSAIEKNRENDEKFDRASIQFGRDALDMAGELLGATVASFYSMHSWHSGDVLDKLVSTGLAALVVCALYISGRRLLGNYTAMTERNASYARFPPELTGKYGIDYRD
jgi:hypothetical protein